MRFHRDNGQWVLLALALAIALLLALATAGGAVWGLYTAKATNSGDELKASSDWVAPTASATVIGKNQGGMAGFIHQGGGYNVYANAADAGNPALGVSGVSANVSSITAGQSAVTMPAGSFAIGGTAYGFRTAALTASATLAAGTYTYLLTSTDAGGNSRTQGGYSVVVDNTAPSASDIQTANRSGNTVGKAEIGDSITYTFSEQIDPNSILAGWTGASTPVVVRITNTGQDPLTVYNSTNTVQLPLGSVNLGRNDYVSASATFGATGTASTMVQSGNTITITLGTASAGATTASSTSTMVWTPSASAYDRAGNAETTTSRSETGAADKEF